MKALTLDEVDQMIADYYYWFYKNEPGVVVQEMGDLARLWALSDNLHDARARSLPPDQRYQEYGLYQ